MCIELRVESPASASRPRSGEVAQPAAREPKRSGRRNRRAQPVTVVVAPAQREPRKTRKEKRKQRGAPPVQVVAPTAPKLVTHARDVEGLVRAFEDGTLPREDWTHAAHLVVALAYAHQHRLEAYTRLRDGIRRYNAASGLVETPTRGFHETITRAWFQLVLHFLDLFDDGRPLPELAADLVGLYERDELFAHFSRERLMAPGARSGWVTPDLRPLPALEPLTPADRRWLAALEARVAAIERTVVTTARAPAAAPAALTIGLALAAV